MKSFPSPLLATLLHLLFIVGLSAVARALARCRSGRPRAALSWADCLSRAAAAALSISLDIGLSNWSSLYITVSLYTMTKSSAISLRPVFFTALQAGGSGLQNRIDTLFHLQPLMFLGLFPLFVLSEGLPLSISEKLFCFHEAGMLFCLVGKLFLGGILAFGLGFSEFLLISRTSSLTLFIAGVFKEICILLLATHLLGDRLSLLNWLGFAVCLSGISLHVILKAMNSKGEKSLKLHREASSDPDLELLLHPTEHGGEEEEDLEPPQQH